MYSAYQKINPFLMAFLVIIKKFLHRQATLESLNLSIYKLSMADYEQNHHDKDALQKYATILGNIDVNPVSDLEQIRVLINRFCEELPDSPKLSPDWCFVDCKSNFPSISAGILLITINFRLYGRTVLSYRSCARKFTLHHGHCSRLHLYFGSRVPNNATNAR